MSSNNTAESMHINLKIMMSKNHFFALMIECKMR